MVEVQMAKKDVDFWRRLPGELLAESREARSRIHDDEAAPAANLYTRRMPAEFGKAWA
jgi:hypothetical protein